MKKILGKFFKLLSFISFFIIIMLIVLSIFLKKIMLLYLNNIYIIILMLILILMQIPDSIVYLKKSKDSHYYSYNFYRIVGLIFAFFMLVCVVLYFLFKR
jgi:hypothetical protein